MITKNYTKLEQEGLNSLAKITVIYNIPDGDSCTIITPIEGHILDNVEHCLFRTGYFKENGLGRVECTLFQKQLKLDERQKPFKCSECMGQQIVDYQRLHQIREGC
jgi:hypothetical protein